MENKVADVLSHLVNLEDCEKIDSTEESDWVCALDYDHVTEEKWCEEMEHDATLKEVIALLQGKWSSNKMGFESTKPFWCVKDDLAVDNLLLFRGSRLVPPLRLRNELVSMAHATHPGITKAKERLRMSYWWPGMDKMVEREI